MVKEKILCAAIWYKELPLVINDIPSELLRPVNCRTGIVFCGHRHPHCLYQMVAITGKADHEAGHGVQGFLTDTNRFVDRNEAALIALSSGQIEKLQFSSKELFSEDLY